MSRGPRITPCPRNTALLRRTITVRSGSNSALPATDRRGRSTPVSGPAGWPGWLPGRAMTGQPTSGGDGHESGLPRPRKCVSTAERKRGPHFTLAADPSHSVRNASRPMESELSLACTSLHFSHYLCMIAETGRRACFDLSGRAIAWRRETRWNFSGLRGSEEGVSVSLKVMPPVCALRRRVSGWGVAGACGGVETNGGGAPDRRCGVARGHRDFDTAHADAHQRADLEQREANGAAAGVVEAGVGQADPPQGAEQHIGHRGEPPARRAPDHRWRRDR